MSDWEIVQENDWEIVPNQKPFHEEFRELLDRTVVPAGNLAKQVLPEMALAYVGGSAIRPAARAVKNVYNVFRQGQNLKRGLEGLESQKFGLREEGDYLKNAESLAEMRSMGSRNDLADQIAKLLEGSSRNIEQSTKAVEPLVSKDIVQAKRGLSQSLSNQRKEISSDIRGRYNTLKEMTSGRNIEGGINLEEFPTDLISNTKSGAFLSKIQKPDPFGYSVPQVSAKDALKGFRMARDEAAHLNRMSKSDTIDVGTRDRYSAQSFALKDLSKRLAEAFKGTLNPEEASFFNQLQSDYAELQVPFVEDVHLFNATELPGKIGSNNFLNQLTKSGYDQLIEKLSQSPEFLESLTSHDARGLNIRSPEKIQGFLSERGPRISQNERNALQEAFSSYEEHQINQEIAKIISKSQISLRKEAPHVSALLQKRPDLKKAFLRAQSDEKLVAEIRSQLKGQGIKESEINTEIERYKRTMEEMNKQYGPFTKAGKWLLDKTITGLFLKGIIK